MAMVLLADACAKHAISLITAYRSLRVTLPILVATTPELHPHVVVQAFAVGADECISLPLNDDELVARSSALLARTPRLDELTKTEKAIFLYLCRHRGKWLGADEIIEEVLGTAHTHDTALVRVHIHNLRRKLSRHGLEIHSKRGQGYRL